MRRRQVRAVSYVALCDLAAEASQSAPFKRVAVWGERVATGVLSRFASVSEIRIRIRDPAAAVASKIDQAGVELTRVRSTEVAFSLGSNVGNKTANLRSALARLDGDPHIEIDAVSHFYRTEPWGKSDQDWFVNACATGRTSLRPRDLLRRCKAIEISDRAHPGRSVGAAGHRHRPLVFRRRSGSRRRPDLAASGNVQPRVRPRAARRNRGGSGDRRTPRQRGRRAPATLRRRDRATG